MHTHYKKQALLCNFDLKESLHYFNIAIIIDIDREEANQTKYIVNSVFVVRWVEIVLKR